MILHGTDRLGFTLQASRGRRECSSRKSPIASCYIITTTAATDVLRRSESPCSTELVCSIHGARYVDGITQGRYE